MQRANARSSSLRLEEVTGAPFAIAETPWLSTAFRTVLLPSRLRRLARYGVAAFACGVGAALMVLLAGAFDALVLTVPLLSILVSSWFGGLRVGLLATVVLGGLAFAFVPGDASRTVGAVTLMPVGIAACVMVEIVRRAAEHAAAATEDRLAALAEYALAQSRLDHALEGSHLVAFTQDRELRYTWIKNPHPAFANDRVIGKSDAELLPADEAARLAEVKGKVMDSGQPQRTEVRLTNGAEQRVYDLSIRPMRSDAGEVVGVFCLSTDITERDRMQQELVAANRAKDEFLSLVSHEFKTPITVIRGNAGLLQRPVEGARSGFVQEAALEIEDAASRLEGIVDDLLALSRLDRGGRVEVEPVLLHQLLAGLVREHQRRFPGRRIELPAEVDREPVFAHPRYLAQVLRNLLSNAEKYSPPSQPVEIAFDVSAEGATIRVRDHGTGIPEAEQEKIFESFYRSSASQPAPGIGVGLRVCRVLMEAQGGTISVRNHPASGAEFVLHFQPQGGGGS